MKAAFTFFVLVIFPLWVLWLFVWVFIPFCLRMIREARCDFKHPHPEHPCGRRIVVGVTRCSCCGNLDGSAECAARGCWVPATPELLNKHGFTCGPKEKP